MVRAFVLKRRMYLFLCMLCFACSLHLGCAFVSNSCATHGCSLRHLPFCIRVDSRFDQYVKEVPAGCDVLDCPRHIDMSGDRKPDPVEHFNRDLSIYCVQPQINQCGDPEVTKALQCGGQNAEGDKCTGVLKYHHCSLPQVIRALSCVLQ